MSHNNKPREAGTRFERQVADYYNDRGLPWDRAPLRGRKDLLDLAGPLAAGWLVGTKAKSGDAPLKLYDAMNQARRAVDNLPGHLQDGVIPVQVVQRARHSTAESYVVMELRDHASLVLRLAELERRVADLDAAELERARRAHEADIRYADNKAA